MANFPTESKVKAAASAAGITGAVVTLLMYLLDLVPAVHDMDPTLKGALLALVTGAVGAGATYVAGWWAKHTPRPSVEPESGA